MAPKPKGAGGPKKPTGSGTPKNKKDKGGDDLIASHGSDDLGASAEPPKNKEEALAQINFEGLPSCPTEDVINIMKDKYETIVKIFAYYCKYSECKTIEMATRMRLPGFKKLVKDLSLIHI